MCVLPKTDGKSYDGRAPGVPDFSEMSNLVRKAESLGFMAVWTSDVPVFDTVNFGDAGPSFL